MTKILSGKPVAAAIRSDLMCRLGKLPRPPRLAIYADLTHPPSRTFVTKKVEFCNGIGVESSVTDLSQVRGTAEASEAICDDGADGVLVQLPVPPHLDRDALLSSIHPMRDVDGFHPRNLGDLLAGHPKLVPCTALACCHLLDHYAVHLHGAHVVVVNDTLVLGKPLAALLNHRGATVTLCNKHTKRLTQLLLSADIVVTAVGTKTFEITPDMVHGAQIVVDVAIREFGDKIIGDLTPQAANVVAAYTPVPGGVGPVTVACVAGNLIQAAEESCGTQVDRVERVA